MRTRMLQRAIGLTLAPTAMPKMTAARKQGKGQRGRRKEAENMIPKNAHVALANDPGRVHVPVHDHVPRSQNQRNTICHRSQRNTENLASGADLKAHLPVQVQRVSQMILLHQRTQKKETEGK